ncbi:MAG: hypothetical protein A3F73_03170 [Gallionellales bacterium RIFCSPLOWO2_12_FULL_59_22]|nr:MAG: hypothetical protein A3H99_06505 [Gallionellales bacterium RIFCSPLOWO2_02_FULL_59_110]OGT05535.1 MAG: hypothetical protein A2Z65_12900 [Gallionellales bacterium RIFCSPLOWO2_02_58_13]OGT13126.1 MAG: hypothetical protein A3F73_03170 [Gallionellales bacterium RIFCSPLOWO2_12_FULL_59_22]
MEAVTVLLWMVAALLVMAGIAGLALPAIPGAAVLFAGLVLAAWIEDFAYAGVGVLSIIAALAVLTYVVDFAAGMLGAKHFGASRRAMAGAMLGAILGIFFGLPGLLFGPFAGAAIGEFSERHHIGAAGRAGVGATLGLVLGVAAKLALAFSMLAVFAAARFMI